MFLRYTFGLSALIACLLPMACRPDQPKSLPKPADVSVAPALSVERPWSVLIDISHGQLNATPPVRVDSEAPEPLPTDPRDAQDWDGVLSSFAWRLHRTGAFRIVQTSVEAELKLGNCSDRGAWAYDLACHDLFISIAPNTSFSPGEKQAIAGFLGSGGGLLVAAQHYGSNSEGVACDGDGLPARVGPRRRPAKAGDELDSTGVLAELAEVIGMMPAGGPASPCRAGDPRDNSPNNNFIERGRRLSGIAGNPLLNGPFGPVRKLSFEGSTSFTRVEQSRASAITSRVERKQSDAMIVATSISTRGRVAAFGDATLFVDGSSSSEWGRCRFRDPRRPDEDADRLVLNAVAWLIGPGFTERVPPERTQYRAPVPDPEHCRE